MTATAELSQVLGSVGQTVAQTPGPQQIGLGLVESVPVVIVESTVPGGGYDTVTVFAIP